MPMPKTTIIVLASTLTLLAVTSGCVQPVPDGNNNTNTNTNTNGNSTPPTEIVLALGEAGVFSEGITVSLQNSASFDVSDQVPAEEPADITLAIDPADIAVGTSFDADTTGAGSAVILAFLAPFDAEEPCTALSTLYFFDVMIESNAVASVSPDSAAIGDSSDFGLLRNGQFSLCFGASATREVAIKVAALRITYTMPGPATAANCAEVRALPQVQSAIGGLAASGTTFSVPAGSDPPNVEGTYALAETTTFDPDGDNTGDTLSGTVTLDNQSGASIRRTGFDASVDQFISGNATSVGFCTLARTGDPACDQTIARLESLAFDATKRDMTGNFLAVVVSRNDSTSPTCADAGSYIYGDITLSTQQAQFAELRGKVQLAADITPDLLILPGDGGDGTVTDFDGPTVLHFATTTPFDTTPLVLPNDLTPQSFSALGLSRDNTRLAVVTNKPDAAITYDNSSLQVVRATSTTNYDYIGGRVDFDIDATRIYVPSTRQNFADRITVLRTDDSTFGDIARKLTTPLGRIPVQARVSPDGTRMAVLLEAGAPIGEAGELTFGRPDTGGFLKPPINLVKDAGGTVLATELLYASDGSQIFLAGLGAVIAVEAKQPYTITRIDVSEGAGDNPIALAMSGDGKVLVAAIDNAAGSADFAVIDTASLKVLNTQDLPGIGPRRALDIAHFQTTRVAMVANQESTVVAVQTTPPYAAATPVLVADVTDKNALGRIESGGNTIAVTNTEEPAIYLFQPSP